MLKDLCLLSSNVTLKSTYFFYQETNLKPRPLPNLAHSTEKYHSPCISRSHVWKEQLNVISKLDMLDLRILKNILP